MSSGPVGCADGSHLVRASDHATLMHNGLRGDFARAVRDALARTGPATFIFAQDAIVHDEMGENFLGYVRTWSSDVRKTDSTVAHDWWTSEQGVTAVVAVGTAKQIHGAHEEITRTAGAGAQVATFPIRRLPDAWGMIARAAGGTKGSALTFVAEHYGCTPEETVCVGDWLNDVSMFAVAGRSYAMGHAPYDVKRVASVVLDETGRQRPAASRARSRTLFGDRASRERAECAAPGVAVAAVLPRFGRRVVERRAARAFIPPPRAVARIHKAKCGSMSRTGGAWRADTREAGGRVPEAQEARSPDGSAVGRDGCMTWLRRKTGPPPTPSHVKMTVPSGARVALSSP